MTIKTFLEAIKPDRVETISGYRWLDAVTYPFWEWRMRRQERQLYKIVGAGNISRGRRIMRRVFEHSYSHDPRIWRR